MEKKKIVKKLISISTAIAIMLNSPYALDLLIKAEPESGVVEPESGVAESEPDVEESEPTEPTVAVSEPTVVELEPSVAEPDPAAAEAEPDIVEPELGVNNLSVALLADGDTHTHDGWQPWSDESKLPTVPGNYYLTNDVSTYDGQEYADINCDISLCLNGHKINLESDTNIAIKNGATFTLYNCGSSEASITPWFSSYNGVSVESGGIFVMHGGKISGFNAQAQDGGGVYVADGGTFIMDGGTIENCTTYYNNGAGVYVANGGEFTMSGDSKISGCNANEFGGGIYVESGGEFTMNSGTISDCAANSTGGGVYNAGSFTMNGGTIDSCESGGGVYNAGTFKMNDATISNCTASSQGGGVYNEGSFTMDGNSLISSCSAGSNGGGVYIGCGKTFEMKGGTIENCTQMSYGAGVYIEGGTFTMSGSSKISGCNAIDNGGGVFVSCGYNEESETVGGTFNMNGGTIDSCTATKLGGGVYMNNECTFLLNGGTINKCSSTAENGGGVYNGSGIFTMKTGSTISYCEAIEGGGVYHSNGTFSMEGGTIDHCTATENGGGVYNYDLFTMNDGTISNCDANEGGGVYDASGFTMSGGTISNCNANKGGGVSFYSSSNGITLDGKVIISSNTSGTDPDTSKNNNLYLPKNNLVAIGTNFKDNSTVGVTHYDPPSDDGDYSTICNPGRYVSGGFFSDDDRCHVKYDADNYYIRLELHDAQGGYQYNENVHYQECSGCGKRANEAAHTWVKDGSKAIIMPDVNEETGVPTTGTRYLKCEENCGATKEEEIPAVTDETCWTKVDGESKDPTSTTAGYYTYSNNTNPNEKVKIDVMPLSDVRWWTQKKDTFSAPGLNSKGSCTYTSPHFDSVDDKVNELSNDDFWVKTSASRNPEWTATGSYVYRYNEAYDGYSPYLYDNVTIEVPKLQDSEAWTPATTFDTPPTETNPGILDFTSKKGFDPVNNATIPELTDTNSWNVETTPSVGEQDGEKVYTSKFYPTLTVTVPIHAHKWGNWTWETKPSINGVGTAKRTCTKDGCDDTEKAENIPALSNTEHWQKTSGNPPTWSDPSQYTYHYIKTSNLYEDVTIDVPKLQDSDSWTPASTFDTPPTETTTGMLDFTSKIGFDAVNDATIPSLSTPGAWTKEHTDPSGTSDGSDVYTLKAYPSIQVTVSICAHNWGAWTWNPKPTISTTGKATRTCSKNNSHTQTETVPALSNTTVWTKVDAECEPATETDPGKDVYSSEYGKVEVTIPALGHECEWSAWTLSTKPTINGEGQATRTCTTNADHKETKSVPALSNTTVWTKVDAECEPATETDPGKDVYSSEYGKVEVTIPALGHECEWSAWTLSTKPTINGEGQATRTCTTNADHKETKPVPALSDTTVWTKVVAECEPATETDSGKDVYNSEYGKVEVTIPKLNHTHTLEEVPETPATETETGVKKHWKCTDTECGKLFSDAEGKQEITEAELVIPKKTSESSSTTPTPTGSSSTTTTTPSTTTAPSETTAASESTPAATVPSSEAEPTETDFLPNIDLGSIEKKVEQKEDVPTAKLETPVKELLQAIMPTEELEAIKETDNIKIILKIEDASETVPTEDKQQVEAVLQENSNYTLDQYLDVTLLKIINNNETKITNTSAPITVTFEVPENSRRANRAFAVIRVHSGERTVLNDLDDDPDTVTIQTDKFSTYALAYIDKEGNPNTGVYVSIIPLAVVAASLGALAIKKKSKQK